MALDIAGLYGSVYDLGYGSTAGRLSAAAGVGQAAALSGLGVAGLNRQASSYQVQLSAYGKLQSAINAFKDVLGAYQSARDVAPFKATSSDTATLTATAGKNTAAATSSRINVTQLARAQSLTSAAYPDEDATIVGSGSMTFQLGSYNSVSNTFTPADSSGGKTLSITPANGTLSGIAIAINEADAGVKASVVKSAAGYQLSLTSTQTGTDSTIKLSVSDNDGTHFDSSGLSALAYDPIRSPGGGKNLTETSSAQNAKGTVDGTDFTSQSNAVTEVIENITLTLATAGSATVRVAHDAERFEDAAQKFVDAYNKLEKNFGEVAGESFAKGGNGLVTRLDKDLRSALSPGSGSSQTTLSGIGIGLQPDGTLALDKNRLQSAFAADPEAASGLIAESAGKLSAAVSQSNDIYTSAQLTSLGRYDRFSAGSERSYDTSTYFGMPAQSLFSHISSFNTSAQAALYGRVSSL